jgi:transcriptional regulator with XRE-family HTH domain
MPIDDLSHFDYSQFGGRLKIIRQLMKLTLDQFSLLTKEIDPKGEGISKMTLSRYETSATLPGLRELVVLSFATRKPVAVLLYGERDDPMSSYKLTLEMHITETVNMMVRADGVIKEENSQDPFTPEYEQLIEKVRK